MKKSPDWIIVLLDELHLNKYPSPVIWVNKCLRCGKEEPTYSGPQAKEFIKIHKDCKTLEDQKSHEYRTSHLRGNFPGKNLGD